MKEDKHFEQKEKKSQKAIRPLLTSIGGMLPIVVFFITGIFSPYHITLMAGLFTCVAYFVISVHCLKRNPPYIFFVLSIAFPVIIGFSFVKPFNLLYSRQASILMELLIILLLYIFIRIQNYFRTKILLLAQEDSQESQLTKLETDLYLMKIVLFLVVVHLLIVLIYQLLPVDYHTSAQDMFIYRILLLLFVMLYFGYEFFLWKQIKKRIRSEDWLPVVDDFGVVHGKVSLSISRISGNKYLHPVIRIVFIHRGLLFLKEQTSLLENEVCRVDYPFERYLRFEETLEEGVKKTLEENGIAVEFPCRFVFHYIYKNIKVNRLIYLYACNIQEEKYLDEIRLESGKWWTSKQISENLNTGLFSIYFEKEYELLKSTLLMAEQLMRGNEE
jgi:hypothetical protein